VRDWTRIVLFQALGEVVGEADVVPFRICLACEDADVVEQSFENEKVVFASGLPRRSLAVCTVRARLYAFGVSGGTNFALRYAASEVWRRGESNPCP